MLYILISSYLTHLLNALISLFLSNFTVVCTIVDSIAPFNIVTTLLCKKLNILPDPDYAKEFGTSFLKRYKVIMDHDSSSFHILGCNLTISIQKILSNIPLLKTFNLVSEHKIILICYNSNHLYRSNPS